MTPTAASIIAEHADNHGFTLPEFLDREKKHRALARARQDAMADVRRRTDLTLRQIAQAFGMADHSGISISIRASEARKEGKAA